MRDVEPPGEQLHERPPGGVADGRRAVLAEHCDPDRAGVEALRVGADDCLVDPPVAALEDLPVLVDEEVVADVVPAVPLHVVQLDPAHDRGRLGRRVVVRAGGVVDDGEVDAVRDLRRPLADRLVRVPTRSRDDVRRAGDREPPRRGPLHGALDVVRAEARHGAACAEANGGRGADPVETAEPPARKPVLGAGTIRVLVCVREAPRAPASGGRECAIEDVAGAAPVHAEQVEARRRGGCERPPSAERDVLRRHAHARRSRGGGGEQERDREQEGLHPTCGPTRVADASFGGKPRSPSP